MEIKSLYYYILYRIIYLCVITMNIGCTTDINPYKDIQKILSEDFNPHLPQVEHNVMPWKMNYSFKNKKILEFKNISDFPLDGICKCTLEEVNEEESNIIFGSDLI
ncbi:putative integral membrane protein [Theileria parva strain Muguga]|uniref:putative integral membrane protein n=1 Tax=Theileria parva strain Muguga TaxID=333668 RepID=UPI001C617518|nr:putative integral membrane protein [Theileria parva strain Muguga]KAF5153265.1 putative integral membrane protein [Theileria parva strain Muguga]